MEDDLPAIDDLTVRCYAPIQASYVAMLGEELHEAVRLEPELTWEQRKIAQNRRLFAEGPGQVWVLEEDGGTVFGFLDNNGVAPERASEGWATFMYRQVLEHFRSLGLRYAHVDTGLDDAHIPARRAYEAVGFDRAVHGVDLWQDLRARNAGSTPTGEPAET